MEGSSVWLFCVVAFFVNVKCDPRVLTMRHGVFLSCCVLVWWLLRNTNGNGSTTTNKSNIARTTNDVGCTLPAIDCSCDDCCIEVFGTAPPPQKKKKKKKKKRKRKRKRKRKLETQQRNNEDNEDNEDTIKEQQFQNRK